MSKEQAPQYKRHMLGAQLYKPKTEDELKAERANQELESRKQMEKRNETK